MIRFFHQKIKSLQWLLFANLMVGILLTGVAFAQVSEPVEVTDDQVNAVAKQLYCPVCENIPLDVCPTQACAQWRGLIGEKLAAGWSEEQIKDYFVAQYGDRVLATPPARGLNLLVYIIPPVAIILGVFILYRAMKSWRRPAPAIEPQETSSDAPGDEYVARLEEELRSR
jgi:cytochrome c-type biogenesis protein CcmH